MPRFVALLRAINVGGRTVRMATLKTLFEDLGFREVATFIASGNVVFATRSTSSDSLRRRIAAGLRDSLGFEVETFIRSEAEVAAISRYLPFSPRLMEDAAALNVGFLHDAPARNAQAVLRAHQSDQDEFRLHGREVYWLSRVRQSQSPFFRIGFERVLRVPVTVRTLQTIQRLALQHGFEPDAG